MIEGGSAPLARAFYTPLLLPFYSPYIRESFFRFETIGFSSQKPWVLQSENLWFFIKNLWFTGNNLWFPKRKTMGFRIVKPMVCTAESDGFGHGNSEKNQIRKMALSGFGQG